MLTDEEIEEAVGKLVKIHFKNDKILFGTLDYSFQEDIDNPEMNNYMLRNGDWLSLSFHAEDIKILEIYNLEKVIEVRE